MDYFLLDSRAAFASLNDDEIKDSSILLCGTAKECCQEANEGNYGDGCVVSDDKLNIKWEWFKTGKWIVN